MFGYNDIMDLNPLCAIADISDLGWTFVYINYWQGSHMQARLDVGILPLTAATLHIS